MKSIKVFLREKKISKGRKSLYLDFYPAITNPNTGKQTRREFLGLYIFERPRSPIDREHNKNTISLAKSLCARRLIEIQTDTYGFKTDRNKDMDFFAYFDSLAKKRYESEGNYGNWKSAFKHLKTYRPQGATMSDLDAQFIEGFITT